MPCRPGQVTDADRLLVGSTQQRRGVVVVAEQMGSQRGALEVAGSQRVLVVGGAEVVVRLRPGTTCEGRAGALEAIWDGHRGIDVNRRRIPVVRAGPSLQPAAPPEQHDEAE